MDIATAIRKIAAEKGMTLGAVADAAQMRRRQTFSEKMNGHSDFTVAEIGRVARAFGITVTALVARAEAATASPTSPTPPAAHSATALAGALDHVRQSAEEVA